MIEEHVKLVAKIQHFYDVMVGRLNEMDDASITSLNDIETLAYKEKSVELNFLTFEYAKTFENFIYRETNDKT